MLIYTPSFTVSWLMHSISERVGLTAGFVLGSWGCVDLAVIVFHISIMQIKTAGVTLK